MAEPPNLVPVITIGGYLGAGKTTLLNALLAGDHGRRIAVLVNDFGAVSIDEKLIVSREGDVVTLANGCACCSVAGDLGEALDKMATTAPDCIAIEASGVADPARIAALARAPGLAPGATIVLADSETIAMRAHDKFVGQLIRRQLAAANMVVLNKIDLADSATLGAARDLVGRVAPAAQLVETSRGVIPTKILFGTATPLRSGLTCDASDEAATTFESHCWTTTDPVDIRALQDAVVALPAYIVRVKGVVPSPERGRTFEIHRVGNRVDVAPLDHTPAAVDGADLAFVALTGTLDRHAIDVAMSACICSFEAKT